MREFHPNEDAEVTELQRQYRAETELIVVGYRAGLKAGLRRAIAVATVDAPAIQRVLDE